MKFNIEISKRDEGESIEFRESNSIQDLQDQLQKEHIDIELEILPVNRIVAKKWKDDGSGTEIIIIATPFSE